MARATIDFGIDLGTTNSEIAVIDKGQVRVIRNTFHQESTPSAVRIDARNAIQVGKLAYDHRVDDVENTQVRFKLLMGSQQILGFHSTRRKMTPEELSAEVLKVLRQDVSRDMGEDVSAAVITIPAMFEMPQCDATRRAAELAGITCYPLLQEPIAAALAHRFQDEGHDGFCLVYDLGGGTFDTSILRSDGGYLTVVDHAGDNFLGGGEFDLLLVDHIVEILYQDFGLEDRQIKQDKGAYAKLLFEAENAKIQLTSTETAYVSFNGLGKRHPNFEAGFEIVRSQYESLIERPVHKTLAISQGLLAANRLGNKDIASLLLVGGPTLTPYVRAAVEEALGVKPEFKVDPITIVAHGAALFAASQRIPTKPKKARKVGVVPLKLSCEPVCQDIEADVGVKIEQGKGDEILRFEIVRTDGGWTSGQIEVSKTAFLVIVVLEPRTVNEFTIRLTTESGDSIPVEPDRFSITQGLPEAMPPPLSRSIRVGFEDNSTERVIPKGSPIPCKGGTTVQSSHEIARAAEAEILNIPLLQGEEEKSDRNREIGTLRIKGDEIPRTLPAGSDVTLTVTVDAEFRVAVTAFIPHLNQVFEHVCKKLITPLPIITEMESDLEKEKNRLHSLIGEIEDGRIPGNEVKPPELQMAMEDLEREIDRARNEDPHAAEKARRGIEDVRTEIDAMEKSLRWPMLLQRLEEVKAFALEAIQTTNNPADRTRYEKLLESIDATVSTRDAQALEEHIGEMESFTWEIYMRQDHFWVGMLQRAASHHEIFVDKQRGSILLEEGALAVERGDFESLRTIVGELWGLIPETEETSKDKLRFPSSVRRKKPIGYL